MGVAIDPAGNFLVTWSQEVAFQNALEVRGQRLAAGGGALDGNFTVGGGVSSFGPWRTSPGYDARGNFMVGALNWFRLYEGP